MNKLVVSLLLTLGVAGAATAAQPIKGDAAAGQAKTAVCGACHNPDGNSLAPNFPKLAGQGQRYLEKQLHDIKSGKRTVLEMTGMLAAFSDQDLADIAAYFSSQKGSVGAADPKLVERGRALFNGGDLEKGMPACTGCHSPNGAGIALAGFPHLVRPVLGQIWRQHLLCGPAEAHWRQRLDAGQWHQRRHPGQRQLQRQLRQRQGEVLAGAP
jgi:cytochrome c553